MSSAAHLTTSLLPSVVPEAMHEASRGLLKGSAKKALQGSETETWELLGGMEEKRISHTRGH